MRCGDAHARSSRLQRQAGAPGEQLNERSSSSLISHCCTSAARQTSDRKHASALLFIALRFPIPPWEPSEKETMDDFKAITWRPGTDLPLLLDGKIDSEVTVYNNEVVAWGIEHPELKLKVWTMASLGFDTPGYVVISSEEYAAKNPKIVSGFAKATFKGTDYALKNADEAVDILVKAAPELKKDIESAKWKATIGPRKVRQVGKTDLVPGSVGFLQVQRHRCHRPGQRPGRQRPMTCCSTRAARSSDGSWA
jgi:hypothetical protein